MGVVWFLIMRFHPKCKCQLCFRVKLKIVVSCVAVAGVLFILYQILLLGQQLENVGGTTKEIAKYEDKNKYREYSQTHIVHSNTILPVRGIHNRDSNKYKPNSRGKFVCAASNNEIDFLKVNDDYCDCPEDGSDEPGTSACQKGTFVCLVQGSKVGFSDTVPSSRVNDGICDCCDGSDEWKTVTFTLRLKDSIQQKLGRYLQPCPNLCLV